MFTLDKLLSVPIQGRYYYYVWLVIAGVFAPTYFLGGLPATEHILQTNYSKPLKILLLYIVMPIITVYSYIICIFCKILITLQWPVGMVAHLVIWYSNISTGHNISYLSAYRRKQVGKKLYILVYQTGHTYHDNDVRFTWYKDKCLWNN